MRIRHWTNVELRHGEQELGLVEKLVKGGNFVDVGANRGIYSALALRYCAAVIAFEPVPVEARELRRLIGRRGTVHEVALSDASGMIQLHIPYVRDHEITSRASVEPYVDIELPHRPITVKRERLDSFALDNVSLIKIDVEGHEAAVLRGALETLSRCRPAVIVEVEEARMPGSFSDITGVFAGLGYRGYWMDGATLRPLDEFDMERDQNPDNRPRVGEMRVKRYVNNFVWLDSSHPASLPD
jgi:FkbM family methyltransferase